MRQSVRYSGLTLVEMLVVLIIVGLVSTLLVQGLGNALSLYSRVQSNQKQSYTESMVHRWWRGSILAAAPNRLGEQKFLGAPFQLDLQTHGALLSEEGIITTIGWGISDAYPYQLIYTELSQQLAFNIDSVQKPTFEYADTDGKWHRQWPINTDKNDLPEAVRINLGGEYLYAAIRNHKDQIYFVDEVQFGRGNQ